MLELVVVVIGPNPEKHPYRGQGLAHVVSEHLEAFPGPCFPTLALSPGGRPEAGQGHELQEYLPDVFVVD